MKEVKGCGMRSSVGFLAQRNITGHSFLKEEFQRRRLAGCSSLYKKDLLGHFGCVNAIEFSNNGGEWLVSGGDDRRVLLWHMDKAIHSRSEPVQLKAEHLSNIFCLAFDSTNKRVFSGGNDEQVMLHDVEKGEVLSMFLHQDAVYGLSVSPGNDNVFASSADDGRVLIWDTRAIPQGERFCLASYTSACHSVMFNPAEPCLLATANSKEGVGLWDLRKPRNLLLRYGGSLPLQSAMSVRFSSSGTQLLALRRRLPPVLYDLHSRLPSFQFDHQGYFNSCTMKSCCFAGDRDQYVLSGSDDFNLYMWEIPKDPEAGGPGRVVNGAFMVLKGHRSIVNQVRFNPHTYMICSSGVEKVIKVWSPYQQPDSLGDLEGRVEDKSRSLYTHEEYISLVLNSGSGLSHDYESLSVQEDPRMMAFFDSLVRREIEGWSSDSDSDLSEGTILQLHARGRQTSASAASVVAASAPASAMVAAVREGGAMHADYLSSIVGIVSGESGRRSNSENSSPSSPVEPELLGDEERERLEEGVGVGNPGRASRQRGSRRQSAFMLDLANDDSDSSSFWFNPLPQPHLSSPFRTSDQSASSSSSSSTSSSSSSSSEDEEQRQRQAKKEEEPHKLPDPINHDTSSSSSSSSSSHKDGHEKPRTGRKWQHRNYRRHHQRRHRHHRLNGDEDRSARSSGQHCESKIRERTSSRSQSPTNAEQLCESHSAHTADRNGQEEDRARTEKNPEDSTTSRVDSTSFEVTRNSVDHCHEFLGCSATVSENTRHLTDFRAQGVPALSRVSKRTHQGSEIDPDIDPSITEDSDDGVSTAKKQKT